MSPVPRFCLTLLMGRRVFWDVTADGIIEVPDAADARQLLSFDLHDHRQACATPRPARQGRQAFMREWGEQVHLLDCSAQLHAQYGRDPRHGVARPAGCGLVPGLQLIDLLAQRQGVALAGAVIALCLGAAQAAGRRLVLLFGFDQAGELLRMQEAANPPSLEYLLEDFCRGLAVPVAPDRVVWFDQHDVLAVLDSLLPYPEEALLLGRPLRVWWQHTARALGAATALCSGTALALAWSDWQLTAAIAQARSQQDQVRQHLQQVLQAAPVAVARASSASFTAVFADAEALWQPGTRVRASARPGVAEFTLIIDPLAAGTRRAGLTDVADSALPFVATLQQQRQRPLPEGLVAMVPATSGDLHALYLRFSRQTPVPALGTLAGSGP